MTEQLKPILERVKDNQAVFDMFMKADSVINEMGFERIAVSISGGSDSDVMLDVVQKVDFNKKCVYTNMNTGLEYQATKDHLNYLEDRYGIEIVRLLPEKPIPIVCKEYGQPFLSKMVSENMRRLQAVGFNWEDESLETLSKRYPNSLTGLKWWCNSWETTSDDFKTSSFNIAAKPFLKEFIMENPPQFKVNNVCCKYTKKELADTWGKKHSVQLRLLGERKAEGGARSYKKTCTSINKNGISKYKPLFWLTDDDKHWYESKFDIVHSRCYTDYGLRRTGCVGCPYGMYYENEREITARYEPKLSKACETVFKDAYAYTEAYYTYRKRKRLEKNADPNQMRLEI